MIVAIMQPYFFPYVGYFQLMAAVDCFVFYDDAQYMKGGWINRNRILSHGHPAWWTYPVVRDDFTLPICRRHYARSSNQVRSLLGKLEGAYRDAPHFPSTYQLASDYMKSDETLVSAFNQAHLEPIARKLGIECSFILSSQLDHDRSLTGQHRVIEICRKIGAKKYLNSIGGVKLYKKETFEDAGMDLGFVQPMPTNYRQFDQAHIPFLSILDMLMFNSIEQARAMVDTLNVEIAP